MNTATPTDVQTLRAACDQLVATAADPTTARSVLLRMWALGAAAADDLLTDLHHVAVQHAERTGTEATLPELLHALGHHQAAVAHHHAVSAVLHEYADHHDGPHQADQADSEEQTEGSPDAFDPSCEQNHPSRRSGHPHHPNLTAGTGTGDDGGQPPRAAQAASAAARIHQNIQNRRRTPLRAA